MQKEQLIEEEIALKDGTFIKGKICQPQIRWMEGRGVDVHNAHRSNPGGQLPIGKTVFIPYDSILYIILEP
ncbi:hypothetical protein KKH23_07530 [Patescibacteria group bacterium]|nr:hypothetical protein [Patescibacteria group bacterium]